MQDWPGVLAECGVASLAALSAEASTLSDAGKAASDAHVDAENANRLFRDVGARKKFVDDLNASRKEMDGALAKLPFQDPSLPQDFNDDFFYSDPPRDEEETIEDVTESIATLKAQLAEQEALLAKMTQEAADASKEAAQMEANEKKAEDLEGSRPRPAG